MGVLSEPRYWDDADHTSRAAGADDDPDRTFSAFIPHHLEGWDVGLDGTSLEAVTLAEAALRRLSQRCDAKDALPAEWLVLRAESAASSTIEGVHPSARRLARAEAQLSLFGEEPNLGDLEALRNIAAFERAMEIVSTARPISVGDLTDIHSILMGGDDPSAGQIRTRQNWIGSGRVWTSPLNASYVPPPPEAVPALMNDLLARVNGSRGHPVVEMAVVHAQYEMIHPFGDGNGRTGRALMQMMIQRSRVAPPCTLPISSALALRKDDYLHAMSGTSVVAPLDSPSRSQAMGKWILLASESVCDASAYAESLIARVRRIRADWEQMANSVGLRSSSGARRLLDCLPSNPVLNAEKAASLLDSSWRTGARGLEQLLAAGVLVQRSAGKRNRVYEAPAITGAFAEAVSASPAHMSMPPPLSSTPLPDPDNPLRGIGAAHPAAPQASTCSKTVRSTGRHCLLKAGHKGHCRSRL